jgi:hypothetical protein
MRGYRLRAGNAFRLEALLKYLLRENLVRPRKSPLFMV